MADNFVYDFDTAQPADGEQPKKGASRIRENKNAIAERLNLDHVMDIADDCDTVDTGFHRWVTFYAARNLLDEPAEGDEHLQSVPDMSALATGTCIYPMVQRYDIVDEDDNITGTEDYIELFYTDETGRQIMLTKKGVPAPPLCDKSTIEYDETVGLRLIQPDFLQEGDYTWCHIFPDKCGTPLVISGSYAGTGTAQNMAIVPDGYELISLEIKRNDGLEPVYFRGGICYKPDGKPYDTGTEPVSFYVNGDGETLYNVITLDSTKTSLEDHVNKSGSSYYYMAFCIKKVL